MKERYQSINLKWIDIVSFKCLLWNSKNVVRLEIFQIKTCTFQRLWIVRNETSNCFFYKQQAFHVVFSLFLSISLWMFFLFSLLFLNKILISHNIKPIYEIKDLIILFFFEMRMPKVFSIQNQTKKQERNEYDRVWSFQNAILPFIA